MSDPELPKGVDPETVAQFKRAVVNLRGGLEAAGMSKERIDQIVTGILRQLADEASDVGRRSRE